MPDVTAVDWGRWIAHVAEALGVDPARVDVDYLHRLTKVVSNEYQRPMAVVSAYLLGLAAASHPDRPLDELRDAIVAVARDR